MVHTASVSLSSQPTANTLSIQVQNTDQERKYQPSITNSLLSVCYKRRCLNLNKSQGNAQPTVGNIEHITVVHC